MADEEVGAYSGNPARRESKRFNGQDLTGAVRSLGVFFDQE